MAANLCCVSLKPKFDDCDMICDKFLSRWFFPLTHSSPDSANSLPWFIVLKCALAFDAHLDKVS
jgi:hypothetical protein